MQGFLASRLLSTEPFSQQFFPQKSLFPHSLAQSGIVFTHDFGQVDDCSLRKKNSAATSGLKKRLKIKVMDPWALTRFFHTLKTENNIKALQLDLSLISHRFSVFSRSVLSFQSSTWHQGWLYVGSQWTHQKKIRSWSTITVTISFLQIPPPPSKKKHSESQRCF